jgi:hypothetical protein
MKGEDELKGRRTVEASVVAASVRSKMKSTRKEGQMGKEAKGRGGMRTGSQTGRNAIKELSNQMSPGS